MSNSVANNVNTDADKLKLTTQIHICEVDVDGKPIMVDPLKDDDVQWQNTGET